MTRLARQCGLAALLLAVSLSAARAQQPLPPPAYPPAGATISAREQTCQRLEAQLSALGSGGDAARADQIRRLEETIGRQQADLDRTQAQGRRQGCDQPNFFQMFGGGGRSEQCGPINTRIQQIRAGLAQAQGDLQQLQASNANLQRDGQRRTILNALAQNDCGPQYRAQAAQAARPGSGNFFEQLFGGPGSTSGPEQDTGMGSGYRTVCVRTCDGYFFPISFSTSQNRFQDDEQTCQRMCPAAEVQLFSHRNPGEDMNQAVSSSGQLYTQIPNAFKYKTSWDAACTCKAAGESWANAVKDDPNVPVGQGDIVVTEERAKLMNAPRDAKGRPILPQGQNAQKKGAAPQPQPATAAAPLPPPEPVDPNAPKKPIRSVGPKFMAE
ncbi:MAG: DUF2865 domain-containing protein [Pseudorhodoplanes sp.]